MNFNAPVTEKVSKVAERSADEVIKRTGNTAIYAVLTGFALAEAAAHAVRSALPLGGPSHETRTPIVPAAAAGPRIQYRGDGSVNAYENGSSHAHTALRQKLLIGS